MKTILVLFGGCSTEHAVSLQSAHAVVSHMDREAYTPLLVGITRSGQWLYYTGPLDRMEADTWQQENCTPCILSLDRGRGELLLLDGTGTRLHFDGAFPVLHGKNGEDGTLQGLLELAGVPVIGCGTLSSALCMDKDRAHKLAALAGVKVPRGTVVDRSWREDDLQRAARDLGYPLFVQPVRAGSSFGITRVTGPEALVGAVKEAL